MSATPLPTLFEALKMPGALACYQKLQPTRADPYQMCLQALEAEVRTRQDRAMTRRLRQAKFPMAKEWVELDRSLNPTIGFDRIATFLDGAFVEQRRNLCFMGTQGTGKTHCLIALGRELCRKGYTVRFYTACELVTALEEAKQQLVLSPLMAALRTPNLVILDELGFVPLSDNGARLLFEVFAGRYERGAIAVSTNLTFDKWVEVFGSIELTAALLDRFTHRAEVVPFDGQSVRVFQTRQQIAGTGPITADTSPPLSGG